VSKEPLHVISALEYMCVTMGFNQVAFKLRNDFESQNIVTSQLRGMGIRELVPLTHKNADARVALAFDAGDGIVAKIVPETFYDHENLLHALPPITSDLVETPADNYVIDTYPWVGQGPIKAEEIEDLRTRLGELGRSFNNPYGDKRNIHRMPDKMGTLVSIDSGNYYSVPEGEEASEEMIQAWHTYVAEVFPVYRDGKIPGQDAHTEFGQISLHNPYTSVIGFDHRLENPIIRRTVEQEEPHKQSFWDRVNNFLGGSPEHA